MSPRLACAAVAQNPDPLLQITSYAGVTRTLDDWATVFNLAIAVLPDRPEGSSGAPHGVSLDGRYRQESLSARLPSVRPHAMRS